MRPRARARPTHRPRRGAIERGLGGARLLGGARADAARRRRRAEPGLRTPVRARRDRRPVRAHRGGPAWRSPGLLAGQRRAGVRGAPGARQGSRRRDPARQLSLRPHGSPARDLFLHPAPRADHGRRRGGHGERALHRSRPSQRGAPERRGPAALEGDAGRRRPRRSGGAFRRLRGEAGETCRPQRGSPSESAGLRARGPARG